MFILEFIILFMSKLLQLRPNDSTRQSAQDAYSQTLAKHHTWLIRNGALFAMNFLPCQRALYNQVSILYKVLKQLYVGIYRVILLS